MKKVNVKAHQRQNQDGTIIDIPEHIRTILEDKDMKLGSGLFDNLPEELDKLEKQNEVKARQNKIFNRLRVSIPDVGSFNVNYRKYNCLTQIENPEAKSICWREETTSDLGVSWLIAHSPSATPENVATQLGKFDDYKTGYLKVLELTLKKIEVASVRFYEQNVKDEGYVEMRDALNCLNPADAEIALDMFKKGDINCSAYVLMALRAFTSGINLPAGEKTVLKINEYLNSIK